MLASEPQLETPETPAARTPALSIVVPVPEPGTAGTACLAALEAACASLGLDAEIIAAGSPVAAASSRRVRWVQPAGGGFGRALRAGLDAARGDYVATVDAACGDASAVLEELWKYRETAEVIVASRYVPGADARMSAPRRVASRLLNSAFGRGLSLPVTDLSSAFRLYHADVLRAFRIRATDYDVLPELLVRALAGGWRVREIPLRIELSRRSRAVMPLARLAAAYARTFAGLWQLRNSISAADYDARAHDSIIPLQRYWQRRRHHHVTQLIARQGPVLDVGCGSSLIIAALPPGSVAMDILANKLRYARRFSRRLVRASGFAIPFPDASFPCVLCSQVIEHVPMDSPILSELHRVLAPGGRLVLGTPDYANWEWVWMEKAYGFFKPGGYADEHIAHYTREGLLRHYRALGYTHEDTRYILRGELILAFRKPK
jgi:ubiquinone/menaquinone biosynthesis C-methylase UbiE